MRNTEDPLAHVCAQYEENFQRLRTAYQKNYASENALREFKESLKESAIALLFIIDELYLKWHSERKPEKTAVEIQELSNLLNAVTQCFEATNHQEVISAFDQVKNQSVKLLENKSHEEKIKLGAASPLKEKIKSAAILFVGILALGVLAFGLSTLIFATAGTAVAVGGVAAASISVGTVVSSASSIAISSSLMAVGSGLAALCATQMRRFYTSFFGKTGLSSQLENFHSLLNKQAN